MGRLVYIGAHLLMLQSGYKKAVVIINLFQAILVCYGCDKRPRVEKQLLDNHHLKAVKQWWYAV